MYLNAPTFVNYISSPLGPLTLHEQAIFKKIRTLIFSILNPENRPIPSIILTPAVTKKITIRLTAEMVDYQALLPKIKHWKSEFLRLSNDPVVAILANFSEQFQHMTGLPFVFIAKIILNSWKCLEDTLSAMIKTPEGIPWPLIPVIGSAIGNIYKNFLDLSYSSNQTTDTQEKKETEIKLEKKLEELIATINKIILLLGSTPDIKNETAVREYFKQVFIAGALANIVQTPHFSFLQAKLYSILQAIFQKVYPETLCKIPDVVILANDLASELLMYPDLALYGPFKSSHKENIALFIARANVNLQTKSSLLILQSLSNFLHNLVQKKYSHDLYLTNHASIAHTLNLFSSSSLEDNLLQLASGALFNAKTASLESVCSNDYFSDIFQTFESIFTQATASEPNLPEKLFFAQEAHRLRTLLENFPHSEILQEEFIGLRRIAEKFPTIKTIKKLSPNHLKFVFLRRKAKTYRDNTYFTNKLTDLTIVAPFIAKIDLYPIESDGFYIYSLVTDLLLLPAVHHVCTLLNQTLTSPKTPKEIEKKNKNNSHTLHDIFFTHFPTYFFASIHSYARIIQRTPSEQMSFLYSADKHAPLIRYFLDLSQSSTQETTGSQTPTDKKLQPLQNSQEVHDIGFFNIIKSHYLPLYLKVNSLSWPNSDKEMIKRIINEYSSENRRDDLILQPLATTYSLASLCSMLVPAIAEVHLILQSISGGLKATDFSDLLIAPTINTSSGSKKPVNPKKICPLEIPANLPPPSPPKKKSISKKTEKNVNAASPEKSQPINNSPITITSVEFESLPTPGEDTTDTETEHWTIISHPRGQKNHLSTNSSPRPKLFPQKRQFPPPASSDKKSLFLTAQSASSSSTPIKGPAPLHPPADSKLILNSTSTSYPSLFNSSSFSQDSMEIGSGDLAKQFFLRSQKAPPTLYSAKPIILKNSWDPLLYANGQINKNPWAKLSISTELIQTFHSNQNRFTALLGLITAFRFESFLSNDLFRPFLTPTRDEDLLAQLSSDGYPSDEIFHEWLLREIYDWTSFCRFLAPNNFRPMVFLTALALPKLTLLPPSLFDQTVAQEMEPIFKKEKAFFTSLLKGLEENLSIRMGAIQIKNIEDQTAYIAEQELILMKIISDFPFLDYASRSPNLTPYTWAAIIEAHKQK